MSDAPQEPLLLGALESMSFTMPEVPGVVEHLRLAGLRGRIGPSPHPAASLVGEARLTLDALSETIDRVLALYTFRGKGFSWVVTPRSRPGAKLLDRELRQAGFEPGPPCAGLAHTDLGRVRPSIPDGIRLRIATLEDLDRLIELMAEGFSLPVEVADFAVRVALEQADACGTEIHVAVDTHQERVVGFGYLARLEARPIEGLGGAVVTTSHRGRGIYRALTATRLAAAHRRGAPAVVVQSIRATSGPTLARAGFAEFAPIERFASPRF